MIYQFSLPSSILFQEDYTNRSNLPFFLFFSSFLFSFFRELNIYALGFNIFFCNLCPSGSHLFYAVELFLDFCGGAIFVQDGEDVDHNA